MFEIILATHGTMSDGLKDAAKLIIGAVDNVHTLNLNHGDDVNKLGEKMLEMIDGFGREKEFLFLTDIANASPYNQSLLTINKLEKEFQANKYVLSGVNLPILIQAISEQLSDGSIEETVDQIMTEGLNGISKWSAASLEEDDEDDDF